MTDTLIFDLGMHNGDDTAYYLAGGHRVLAVEANPTLCALAQARFREAIDAGRLTILNRAIADTSADSTFYLSAANDQWSSTDPNWASREDSVTTAITVPSIALPALFDTFGVPHYIKIDIEGADLVALEQLRHSGKQPAFVSVEDCRFGFEYVDLLQAAGYTQFQLSDQSQVAGCVDEATGFTFTTSSSGPFGDALPDAWLGYDPFLTHYEALVRDRGTRLKHARHGNAVWWDIHARR